MVELRHARMVDGEQGAMISSGNEGVDNRHDWGATAF